MAIIEFDNVSFSYDTASALTGVNLRVNPGEFVCLLGANGSGKTTLTRHINALLQPDAGTVRVLGHDTHDPGHLVDIRSNVGMVFQNPDDQIVASLVEDDVAFGPNNLGIGREELRTRVTEALECVELAGFERREVAHLSGGEKQRVAIAGALAMKPKVLVLDEATAMLDPHGRKRLMRICQKLNESGLTIVLVTHLLDEAALANRIIVLGGGKVRLDGPADEVLGDEARLKSLGLIAPFTRLPRTGEEPGLPNGRSPAKETALALEGASFSYRTDRPRHRQANRTKQLNETEGAGKPPWALNKVTLSLYAGEILGIAGRSGSGKSTLLRLAGGLANPAEGRVSFRGTAPGEKRDARGSHMDVGLVFQHPERQLFAATVFDDVAFGPQNLGLPPDEIDLRVRAALEQVDLDLDELRHRSPFSLSGGQQRRVAIAGILACHPSVLVMDEPTAGLDPQARKSLLELIDRLNCEQGMPVMLASHNMDDLMSLCDRIAILEEGTVREILEGHSKSYKSLAALLNA